MRGEGKEGGPSGAAGTVLPYKEILNRILQNRPSGTRQRLSQVLGKNRSFISQITNPNYQTPIPPPHIEPIFETCHFSAEDRAVFLAAYEAAHPGRLKREAPVRRTRRLMLDVPDLGSDAANKEFDRLLEDAARRLSRLADLSMHASNSENI
jgi:hypothetical protein